MPNYQYISFLKQRCLIDEFQRPSSPPRSLAFDSAVIRGIGSPVFFIALACFYANFLFQSGPNLSGWSPRYKRICTFLCGGELLWLFYRILASIRLRVRVSTF